MSAERLSELGKRVSIAIFFGRDYYFGEGQPSLWSVQVEFKDQETTIKLEIQDVNLTQALNIAYSKLDKVVSKGLGSAAMRPALEAPKTDNMSF